MANEEKIKILTKLFKYAIITRIFNFTNILIGLKAMDTELKISLKIK